MKTADVAPLALTLPQVAQALCISRSTVAAMLQRGELPAIRIAGKRRVRRTDLETWLAEQPHDLIDTTR